MEWSIRGQNYERYDEAVDVYDENKTSELRVLALVDRVRGLEAEIAHLKYARDQGEIASLTNSFTWKIGLAVTYPARVLKRFFRKIR